VLNDRLIGAELPELARTSVFFTVKKSRASFNVANKSNRQCVSTTELSNSLPGHGAQRLRQQRSGFANYQKTRLEPLCKDSFFGGGRRTPRVSKTVERRQLFSNQVLTEPIKRRSAVVAAVIRRQSSILIAFCGTKTKPTR